MFISLFVAIVFEVRHKALKPLLNSLNVFWNGMGDIFKNVVTLIITADIFAKGLISLFIDGIISATQSAGFKDRHRRSHHHHDLAFSHAHGQR